MEKGIWKACEKHVEMWINSFENQDLPLFHIFYYLSTFASTPPVDQASYHQLYQQYVDNFIHGDV